jgi:predicted RND superfamily exporter protein
VGSAQNAFAWLAQAVIQYPKRFILGLVLCTLFSLLSATQLIVDPNIIKLLPPDEPATQELIRINNEEGGTHFLNISLRGGTSSIRNRKVSFIADQIKKRSSVEYVLHDLSDIKPQNRLQLALMQLPAKDLSQLDVRLQQAISLGPSMLSPMIASSLFDLGSLSEKIASTDKMEDGEICLAQLRDDKASCEELSQLIIRPSGSPFDNDFAIPFMEEVHIIIEEANLSAEGIEVAWLGGAYRHAVEDVEVVIYDVSRTAILSFSLVLILISLVYREKRALLIIFVPLLMGNIWTWGFTYWIIGELNTFTSFSSAILLGLGVDFAIHLYSRYQEEREKHATPEDAIIETWRRVGPPCAAAGLTSAGGFIALRFGNFLGFQQLGVILAGGILLCLVSVLVGLPLMVLWREGQGKPIVVDMIDTEKMPKGLSYHTSGFFLSVLCIAALLCLTQIQNIRIDYDLSNLRKEGMAYFELSNEERTLADSNFPPVLLEFETEEELMRAHEMMTRVVEDKKEPYINGVLSIFSILPIDQKTRLTHVENIVGSLNHENSKYLPKTVQQNLSSLRSLKPSFLNKEDLPISIQHLTGGTSNRLLLFPQGNMWDVRENNRMARSISPYLKNDKLLGLMEEQQLPKIEQPLENTTVIGEYIARSALFRLIKDDAPRIGFLAFGMIFILSFVDIRSLFRSVSAAMVLAMGLSFACAAFVWCGLSISMISFVGIPILMGIGIDIIIHLIHRIGEEGKGRINIALRTTGKAALYSALTTIVSFSSLLIASNRGIQSLGTMTVLGLVLIGSCAFAMVPLGWMFVWSREDNNSD